jgi:protein TonB
VLEETSMIVVPDYKTVPPLPLPPRPLAPTPPAPSRSPAPVPQTAALDRTPAPIDPYLAPTRDQDELAPPSDPPALPSFAQISADVAPPPPYPLAALRRHIGGVVMLRLRVDASGRPLAATIETSSGSKLLDEAALKFVLARWHFVPATQDGHAVEAEALVPISFVIAR